VGVDVEQVREAKDLNEIAARYFSKARIFTSADNSRTHENRDFLSVLDPERGLPESTG
jgi:hypothetical protein